MKMPGDLKAALTVCQKIAAERTAWLDRANALDADIRAAVDARERSLAALGDSEASGEPGEIEKAREAFRDSALAVEGKLAAKKAITRRLSALLEQSREPLKALQVATDGWREALLAEQQQNIVRVCEDLAAACRKALAIGDAVGVPVLPVAALGTIPGPLDPIPLALDWKTDAAAVQARESAVGPVQIAREIQHLEIDLRNRRDIERGPQSERPDFALVANEPAFVAVRGFKLDGRDYQPGELIARDVCNIDLLRKLFEQGRLTTRASYEAGSVA